MRKILVVAFLIGILGRGEGYQLLSIEAYDEATKTIIKIFLSDIPQYRAFTIPSPPRLVVDLLNGEDSLPKDKIKNTSSKVIGISSQQRLKEPVKIARVMIGLKALFPYQLLCDKNQVIIELETGALPKKEPPEEVEEKILPPVLPKEAILPPFGAIDKAIELKEEKPVEKKEELPISMRCSNIDISDALRALSRKIGKNIVVGPDVSGIITIELSTVTYKQALNMILKPYNYEWVEEKGIIRVDTKEALIKTALTTEVAGISYDKAEDMAKLIEPLLDPDVGGRIVVDKRTNSLIITTTYDNLERIKQVIKDLDSPTPQVMIEAKMVQVNYNEVQTLGIEWGFMYPSKKGEKAEVEAEVVLPGGPARFAIGRIFGNTNVFLNLNNLISQEKAEIIASPKIATSDNQKAKIRVGGQLPYGETTAVAGATGAAMAGITIKFIDLFIELEITPKINPDNTVSLDLKVLDKGGKLDEIWVGGERHTAPVTTEKSIETKILIADGETIVIGGMISEDKKIVEKKVPILCDLPFVGRAFRHKTVGPGEGAAIKKELLIFLTPHILNI